MHGYAQFIDWLKKLWFQIKRRAWNKKIEREREREREREGGRRRGRPHREWRCICNFAVGRACVLCWRPTWTAECKMRKNRSLGKRDRTETRSGKKIEPAGFHWRATYCHGQFLASYPQRGYEWKSRIRTHQGSSNSNSNNAAAVTRTTMKHS